MKKNDSLIIKLIDSLSLGFGKLLAWLLAVIVTVAVSVVCLWPLWVVLVIVL